MMHVLLLSLLLLLPLLLLSLLLLELLCPPVEVGRWCARHGDAPALITAEVRQRIPEILNNECAHKEAQQALGEQSRFSTTGVSKLTTHKLAGSSYLNAQRASRHTKEASLGETYLQIM
jgi:hypothetical protein